MRVMTLLLALSSLFVGTAFAGLIESQRALDKDSKSVFKVIDKAIENADDATYKHSDASRKSLDATLKASRKDFYKAVKRSKTAIY